LSELHQLIQTVTEEMDVYNLTKATRPMMEFVDNLSNWYVRRSRRRFWKSENDSDKDEAYQTLYTVLVEFTKLLAPFMPYVSDTIYTNLTGEDSVHMADWPKAKKAYIKEKLNRENYVVRQVVTLGHAVRDKANIKVRQPLMLVQVGLPANLDPKIVQAQKAVICEELNVKELSVLKDADEFVTRVVIPNAKVLGPIYGGKVQEIIKKAKAGEFTVNNDGTITVADAVLVEGQFEMGFQGKAGFDVASADGISVVLDTTITDELKNEGYAREIIRVIQDLRKDADYKVDDRIYIFVQAEGTVGNAVLAFADYIKRETLAQELQDKGSFEADKEKELDLDGVKVKVAVRK
jgi:isoleucyl-tRNA synthetase